jgi:hypothetical protein
VFEELPEQNQENGSREWENSTKLSNCTSRKVLAKVKERMLT